MLSNLGIMEKKSAFKKGELLEDEEEKASGCARGSKHKGELKTVCGGQKL